MCYIKSTYLLTYLLTCSFRLSSSNCIPAFSSGMSPVFPARSIQYFTNVRLGSKQQKKSKLDQFSKLFD